MPELVGKPAILITWLFTSMYLIFYILMIVMIVSFTMQLTRSAKKKMNALNIGGKQKIDVVYTQKLSSEEDNESDITISDMLSDSVSQLIKSKLKLYVLKPNKYYMKFS